MTMLAPAFARPTAIAFPIPLFPPVTIATLSFNVIAFLISRCRKAARSRLYDRSSLLSGNFHALRERPLFARSVPIVHGCLSALGSKPLQLNSFDPQRVAFGLKRSRGRSDDNLLQEIRNHGKL